MTGWSHALKELRRAPDLIAAAAQDASPRERGAKIDYNRDEHHQHQSPLSQRRSPTPSPRAHAGSGIEASLDRFDDEEDQGGAFPSRHAQLFRRHRHRGCSPLLCPRRLNGAVRRCIAIETPQPEEAG